MNTPSTLGKYTISKTLGKGGMGTVYLGYDKKLNRHVAIKTIRHEEMTGDEIPAEYARRFEIEAKAIAKLNHPNIVSVYDSGEEGDVAYLVMEFVEGHDLKYYFDKQTTFQLDEALRIISGLLEALAHAHDKGVWHRDIKPANVMIDTTGQVKLTDFGVSLISDNAERSRVGTMVGTLNYMSPEQIQSLPISHRTDIFAAGVILFQFLTQKRPFSGNDLDIRLNIINQEAAAPSSFNPDLPPLLDNIVAKAMAKKPEQRYASAREMLADIKLVLAQQGGQFFDLDATRQFYASQGSKNNLEANLLAGTGSGAAASGVLSGPARPGIDSAISQTSQSSASEFAEIEFWRTIKDSNDLEEFALYLSKYPKGTYAAIAARRLGRPGDGSGTNGTNGSNSSNSSANNTAPSSANHSSVSQSGSASKAGKIEPSFADFNQTADVQNLAQSASPYHQTMPAKKAANWIMPVAVLLAAGVIAGALVFSRGGPRPEGESKLIATASSPTASAVTAGSAGAAVASATPAPAASATTITNANAKLAQNTSSNTTAVEAASDNSGNSAASAEAAIQAKIQQEVQARLAAKKRQDDLLLAKQEQIKREELAAAKAKENIERLAPQTNNCLASSSFSSGDAQKTEAEVCATAKAKAATWISHWKSATGIAKGWSKYQNQSIGECRCNGPQNCSVEVSYLAPREGACE